MTRSSSSKLSPFHQPSWCRYNDSVEQPFRGSELSAQKISGPWLVLVPLPRIQPSFSSLFLTSTSRNVSRKRSRFACILWRSRSVWLLFLIVVILVLISLLQILHASWHGWSSRVMKLLLSWPMLVKRRCVLHSIFLHRRTNDSKGFWSCSGQSFESRSKEVRP